MAPLPFHRPQQLSLGPLEQEILSIIWQQGSTTAKAIQDCILQNPDRELAYASVMTVLQRLRRKGWVRRHRPASRPERRGSQAYCWSAILTQEEARQIQAHERLQSFLSVGNPDVVAAFADSLDATSLEQLDAILERIRTIRSQREQT